MATRGFRPPAFVTRVRARIIAISLNEKEPRESKIGLTMRQTGLGKIEWLEAARRKEEAEVEAR